MKKNILILLGIAIALTACNKETNNRENTEDVVFGVYAPFCVENCTKLFLYKNGQIFEQKSAQKFVEDVVFKDVATDSDQSETFISLIKDLPQSIKDSDEMIGCAGCADEPILYFKIFEDSVSKEVRVDTDINELPIGLQTYVSQLLEAIN